MNSVYNLTNLSVWSCAMYSICSEGLSYEAPMDLCRVLFLNQVRAGHRPVRAWFLKIVSKSSVCMCVSTPEAIND